MAVQTSTIRVVADTSQAERALGRLNTALTSLVTAASVVAFAKFADEITNVQNKLALVTQEGQSASEVFRIIGKSAIELGAPLKDVGDLFFRVANNTKDLGLKQTEQLAITNNLIKGFQLTGATMGEVSGGVVQLGQAFAQGVLRGDELNSVMEQLPMVADALAKKLFLSLEIKLQQLTIQTSKRLPVNLQTNVYMERMSEITSRLLSSL